MFGHSDDTQQTQGSSAPAVDNNQPVGGGLGLNEIPASQEPVAQPSSVAQNNFYDNTASVTAQPFAPAQQDNPIPSVAAPAEDTVPTSPLGGSEVDLADIKQKALQELSPLVSHLEQDPLDKFKTTMMMIQASDNKNLIPEAYNAAQAITDEKAKAQALLDIVNEINYFTQQTSN